MVDAVRSVPGPPFSWTRLTWENSHARPITSKFFGYQRPWKALFENRLQLVQKLC